MAGIVDISKAAEGDGFDGKGDQICLDDEGKQHTREMRNEPFRGTGTGDEE